MGKALFLIFFQPSKTTGLQGLDTLSSASQGFLLTLGNEHLLGTLCIIPGQMVGPFMLHLCLESLFCVQCNWVSSPSMDCPFLQIHFAAQDTGILVGRC